MGEENVVSLMEKYQYLVETANYITSKLIRSHKQIANQMIHISAFQRKKNYNYPERQAFQEFDSEKNTSNKMRFYIVHQQALDSGIPNDEGIGDDKIQVAIVEDSDENDDGESSDGKA